MGEIIPAVIDVHQFFIGGDGWEPTYMSFGLQGGSTHMGFVFTSGPVAIPKSAIIVSAIAKFPAQGNYSGADCNVALSFTASDNPAAPTSSASIQAAPITSEVLWTGVPAFSSGTRYNSPDLKDALQEIVNRSGWVSGNNIQLRGRDNNSGANGYRAAYNTSGLCVDIIYTEFGTYIHPRRSRMDMKGVSTQNGLA